MASVWRNRIWAGTKTFLELHLKAPRYEEEVLMLMREDVENGIHSEKEFTEKTGRGL